MGKREVITGFDVSGLQPLTEAQMKFCRGIWEGKSAVKAYKDGFDCGEMSYSSIACEASRLRNNPEISQWINAGYAAHLGGAKVSIEEHLNELRRLKGLAVASGNVSAAVMAETVIGKVAGHHIERIQEVPASDDDLLRELAKTSPAYASELAAKAGIALPDEDRIH